MLKKFAFSLVAASVIFTSSAFVWAQDGDSDADDAAPSAAANYESDDVAVDGIDRDYCPPANYDFGACEPCCEPCCDPCATTCCDPCAVSWSGRGFGKHCRKRRCAPAYAFGCNPCNPCVPNGAIDCNPCATTCEIDCNPCAVSCCEPCPTICCPPRKHCFAKHWRAKRCGWKRADYSWNYNGGYSNSCGYSNYNDGCGCF